jgi:Glycosyl hydrolases family 31
MAQYRQCGTETKQTLWTKTCPFFHFRTKSQVTYAIQLRLASRPSRTSLGPIHKQFPVSRRLPLQVRGYPFYLLFSFSRPCRVVPSAAGSDIILASPPSSNQSLIQYRIIGGTLDLYFFSGPDPKSVIEQYGQVVGLPTRPPNWGFGFHLCRWGYASLSETKEQVDAMRAANIPLEGSFVFGKKPPKMASSVGLVCADQPPRCAHSNVERLGVVS